MSKAITRQEWLDRRKLGLGGSDMAAVLGISKYRTPVDVWLDKLGRSPETQPNMPMKVGTYMEQFIADEYVARTGLRVIKHNALVANLKYPRLIGNVDRLVIPPGKKVAATRGKITTDLGLEAKTAGAFTAHSWGPEGTDEILPEYRVQVEQYMLLTGCPRWDLAVLIGNADFRVYHLTADPELAEMIAEAAREFWSKYVATETPPPATCERDVARLFPHSSEGKALQADTKALGALQQLRYRREQLAEIEKEVEYFEVQIKEAMGDAECLKDGDVTLATWKSSAPRVTVDSKLLRQQFPETFRVVSKTGEPSRRFSLKELNK